MSKRRLKAYLFLIATAVIWGFAGPIIKFTLQGINPLIFLAYRFFISAILGLLYFVFIRKKVPKTKVILKGSVYGLITLAIGLPLLFTGLNKSTVIDLVLITMAIPLVIMLGGHLIFHDRITKREKVGTAIALLGTLFATLIPAIRTNSLRLSGNILIFAFLIFDVFGALYSKKLLKQKIPAPVISNIGFISASFVLIALPFLLYGPQQVASSLFNLELKYHLGVWYMAILSGSLAYFLSMRGYKSIEASEAALFSYLNPVFSVPLAILWLGETLTTSFVVGAIIIATGVTIAEYKKKR